jgi:hypothetical protein
MLSTLSGASAAGIIAGPPLPRCLEGARRTATFGFGTQCRPLQLAFSLRGNCGMSSSIDRVTKNEPLSN